MRSVCLLLLLLIANSSFAQDGDEPKVETKNFEFLLRSKFLSFVIIEDLWPRSHSVGGEFRFGERVSFVADLVHFRWKFEEEVFDLPDPDQYSEYNKLDSRNYVAFEIHHYPQFVSFGELKMYYAAFSKVGRRHVEVEDQYPTKEEETYRLNGSFYDVGGAVGVQIGRRFGVDINLGAAYRNETKSEDIFHVDLPPTYTHNVSDDRWLFNIRVNMFWNLSREKEYWK